MAYLMHIGFDSSARLHRNVYYFEYKGIRYKLIQNNPRKHCDVLLTKLEIQNSTHENHAYAVASEFLSALSWENNARMNMWYLGGGSFKDIWPLKKARCYMYSYPRTPFSGCTIGCNLIKIPEIETQEQKKALILFREARASNNSYLSFLFYWQVLEVGGKGAIGWIDKTYRRDSGKIRFLTGSFLQQLPTEGKNLGGYFYQDCRCAIAHIRCKQGKRQLKLECPEDSKRIAISTQVIKAFAEVYIENELKLNSHLFLARKGGKGFPVFVNQGDMRKFYYKIAYKSIDKDIIEISQKVDK